MDQVRLPFSLVRYDIEHSPDYAGKTMLFRTPDHRQSLRFVAAKHGRDPATFQAISDAFAEFRPHILVVEGIQNTDEVSPIWYADIARRQKGTGGEISHAVNLALDYGVGFVGGEPGPHHILRHLEAQGYTREDYIAFNISRSLYAGKREGPITNDHEIDEAIHRFAQQTLRGLGENVSLNAVDEYKAWYATQMGRPLTFAGMHETDDHPLHHANAHALQRLISAGDTCREPHILSVIAEQFQQHDRVLVVYGSGHLWKLENALKSMLGTAEILPCGSGQASPLAASPTPML